MKKNCLLLALAAFPAVVLTQGQAASQSSILLRLSNPAALDRMVADSAGSLVAFGTFNLGAIPATGAGHRFMWFAGKGAFRAGRAVTTEWDNVSIGSYSTAFGSATIA